jgi:hypothetical protein
MGRANIYLPDDLERRVRAAKIPLSEVCQTALLQAVEAAEGSVAPLGTAVADSFAAGATAGAEWAGTAASTTLLRLLRDARLEDIPRNALPASWFSWSEEQTLAWEAGFVDAARTAVRAALATELPTPTLPARGTPAAPEAVGVGKGADGGKGSAGKPDATDVEDLWAAATAGDGSDEQAAGRVPLDKPGASRSSGRRKQALGDDSGSYVGVDRDGNRVAFDPHAAVSAGKSPLFAVLGQADHRARLTLSIGQDAAARGAAVVVVDLSGTLTSRAKGLGRNVRVIRSTAPSMSGIEDLLRGGGDLRTMWQTVAGLTAGAGLFSGGGGNDDVVKPGYVTVLSPSGDGALGGVLSAASAVRTLAGLTAVTDHPRLLQVDLPTGVTVPAAVAGVLTKLIGTAREHDVAFGLSAESAETVTGIGGSGALLSTVFGFATTSPVEADRLRDLLGAHAPVLLSPPGASTRPGDEAWCVMRDLEGRLGQVRIDGA